MNYKFDETNLITGYIKELLNEFNLPVYTVYREDKPIHKNKLYIDRDEIIKFTNKGREVVGDFYYGRKNLNFTKNLIINSSIYDSYTHTYLGDYLRFLRDYKHINLMSLYNCFNTESPVGLNYNITINDKYLYKVNTSDSNYNYYIIPAKFDEEYTIKIDSIIPYEISCIIYTGDDVLDISKELSKITYKKVCETGKRFAYIYSTKVDTNKFNITEFADTYWQYENNLKILLKLPKSIDSAITVLEGNYLRCLNTCGKTFLNKLNTNNIDCISKLSLLDNTTKISYPFADRLVEYLLGNVICNLETIPNNVSRVQDTLVNNLWFKKGSQQEQLKFKGFYDTWDDFIRSNILIKLYNVPELVNNKKSYYKIYECEGDEYKLVEDIFDYLRPIDIYYDLLGYIDKDTEQNLELRTVVKEEV